MKLLIEQSLDVKETEIKITCGIMDERLNRLIEQIKLYSFSIIAQKDGVTIPVPLEIIYYFEAVDNQVFLYTSSKIYECSKKLYELEELLIDTPFLRISKSCILNTNIVSSVRASLSGRIEATLQNSEKQIVSKHYIQEFKRKFSF